MIDDNVAPTPRPDVDFSSLSPSPTPEQYFLLSRLDGKLTVADLCKISGLGRDKTIAALETLARAGVVEVPGFEVAQASAPAADEPSQPDASDRSETSEQSDAEAIPGPDQRRDQPDSGRSPASSAERDKANKKKGAKKAKKSVVPNFPVPPAEFDYDEALLSADVSLDDQRRREVICLHDQLEMMSFYDLFGLEPEAKRSQIKKAYFRMSKLYHPDKFFRKEMGDFGPMLEQIFKEITKAYRTLSSKRKRREYDRQLEAHLEQSGGASVEAMPQDNRVSLGQEPSTAAAENKKKAAAVLLVRRAEKLKERGGFAEASAEYRKALALNRDGGLALRVARMLLDEAQMAQEAASFCRAAIKLEADAAVAHFLLGRAQEEMNAPTKAIEHYRKALAGDGEHHEASARLERLIDES